MKNFYKLRVGSVREKFGKLVLAVLDTGTYAQVKNEAELRKGSEIPINKKLDIPRFSDGYSSLTHRNTAIPEKVFSLNYTC